MNLGALIRRYRKDRKLPLKAVAEKAGISEGFLSQVENNVNSPSVDTLMKICGAIGVNAGDLLTQAGNQERSVIIRKADWDDIDLPHNGFTTRRFFPPETRTVLDSAILVIEPEKSIPVRKNIKNGQEVLCVLKGVLDLAHGEEVVKLGEGDSVHFFAEPKKQSITNPGRKNTVALWIGTL